MFDFFNCRVCRGNSDEFTETIRVNYVYNPVGDEDNVAFVSTNTKLDNEIQTRLDNEVLIAPHLCGAREWRPQQSNTEVLECCPSKGSEEEEVVGEQQVAEEEWGEEFDEEAWSLDQEGASWEQTRMSDLEWRLQEQRRRDAEQTLEDDEWGCEEAQEVTLPLGGRLPIMPKRRQEEEQRDEEELKPVSYIHMTPVAPKKKEPAPAEVAVQQAPGSWQQPCSASESTAVQTPPTSDCSEEQEEEPKAEEERTPELERERTPELERERSSTQSLQLANIREREEHSKPELEARRQELQRRLEEDLRSQELQRRTLEKKQEEHRRSKRQQVEAQLAEQQRLEQERLRREEEERRAQRQAEEAREEARRHAEEVAKQQDLKRLLQTLGVASVNERRRKKGLLSSGYTYALHVAVISNDAAAVRLLLWAGADRRLVDSGKRTPLALAQKLNKKGSHLQVIDALAV